MTTVSQGTYLVTGANTGLGYWSSELLASWGARVLMACRDPRRAERAATAIRTRHPAADLHVVMCDLADLDSAHQASGALGERLDGVLCNAGVKPSRERRTTPAGHELMFGVNVLGHHVLVRGLADHLNPGARVVTLGSIAHRACPVDVRDLTAIDSGAGLRQYGRTKSAAMMWAFALQRRWQRTRREAMALAAHPGYAVDPLSPARQDLPGPPGLMRGLTPLRLGVLQGKDAGALPLVWALAAPRVTGGTYWGPSGYLGLAGEPTQEVPRAHVLDQHANEALLRYVEEVTGAHF